jgi:hypothetical protein
LISNSTSSGDDDDMLPASQHPIIVRSPLTNDNDNDSGMLSTVDDSINSGRINGPPLEDSARNRGPSLEQTNGSLSGQFAMCTLGIESIFKMMATSVFLYYAFRRSSNVDSHGYDSWRSIAFGLYTAAAFAATLLFACKAIEVNSKTNDNEHDANANGNSKLLEDSSAVSRIIDIDGMLSVMKLLYASKTLRLLVPYQLCFGLSLGFVDAYVNRVLVAGYIGDGYIGALTAISTASAAAVVMPLAWMANKYDKDATKHSNQTKVDSGMDGKSRVMFVGGVCFVAGPLLVAILPEASMGNWPFLVFFFVLHGIARGVWESTNKAVVADLFTSSEVRDPSGTHDGSSSNTSKDKDSDLSSAFATIYFTSGMAGSVGFLVNQSKLVISLLNTLVSASAVVCFYWCIQHSQSKRSMR